MLLNYKDQSSNPKHPNKKMVMASCICNPSTERSRERWISGNYWVPTWLQFQWKTLHRNNAESERGRLITLPWPADACIHICAHTPHTHYIYAYTQNTNSSNTIIIQNCLRCYAFLIDLCYMSACLKVCAPCACLLGKESKRGHYIPELDFWMIVSCHVNAGN